VQKYSVFELKNRVKQGTKKQQYGLGNEGLCEEVFNHRKEPKALIPCQKLRNKLLTQTEKHFVEEYSLLKQIIQQNVSYTHQP
jgi:hypothetical protein